jgi:hypothetical protein
MNVYTLRFKDKSFEEGYSESQEDLNYDLVRNFLIACVPICFSCFTAGALTQQYTVYCTLGGSLLLCTLLSYYYLRRTEKEYSKEVTMLLNVALCAIVSVFLLRLLSSVLHGAGFALGVAVCSLHHTLLRAPRFIENTFLFTALIICYTVLVSDNITVDLTIVLIGSIFFAAGGYAGEKYERSLFWSMEKYYIWYYIANFVMPTKLIVTRCEDGPALDNKKDAKASTAGAVQIEKKL